MDITGREEWSYKTTIPGPRDALGKGSPAAYFLVCMLPTPKMPPPPPAPAAAAADDNSTATDTLPQRQSCDRCHKQKLRCTREGSGIGGGICDRCFRRHARCVYSPRLPKGRPSLQQRAAAVEDHGTGRAASDAYKPGTAKPTEVAVDPAEPALSKRPLFPSSLFGPIPILGLKDLYHLPTPKTRLTNNARRQPRRARSMSATDAS